MATGARRIPAFDDRRHRMREIVTPEAVPISVEVANISERAGAFLLDFLFLNLAVFLIVTPIFYLPSLSMPWEIAIGIVSLINFLIRSTYFLHFELTWGGATPGKRIVGLRVINRNGGPLLPAAVIARNLTREFEIFMPLIILFSLRSFEDWAPWLSAVWLLVIGAIPFLNRDRMRGGDLIAGTIVIAMPRQRLLEDQAQAQFRYSFTQRELSAYGAYELQVLEQVLRNTKTMPDANDVMREIAGKIRQKIGWQGEVPADMNEQFLRDFYTAERAFLEREQLFGKSKADKHDRPAGEPPIEPKR
jgi:uncharacterized RDD family membrane protein YckC